MRVTVNRDTCTGAGQCVLAAADVFDQDDGGLVVVFSAEPPRQLHDQVREAAWLCPSGAISFEE
jgi:ferredoxin